MARSLVLPIESFHATVFPLVYAAKTVASGIVDISHELSKIAPPPSPSPLLFPLRTPNPRLQAISHDPLFGRSKPSNREASGHLRRAHRRPRSPPVLAVVFHPPLIILDRTFFDRKTLGALILLTVLITSVGSLLISSPFPDWFGTHLLPSLAVLNLRSATVSGITPFFPLRCRCLIRLFPRHPQPRLTHLNLSCNALNGFELHQSLLL